MNNKKGSAAIGVLVAVVIVFIGVFAYMMFDSKPGTTVPNATSTTQATVPVSTSSLPAPTKQPKLDSFEIMKPTLYVYGSNLASVKVFGVPTGTGMTESQELGSATLQGTDSTQTWTFTPRQDRLSLTSMSVKGYDAQGNIAATLDLPYSGASEVFGAFY